jgi:hypothetical protein
MRELDEAIFWAARIKHEQFRLADLALCTVQKHVRTLISHVEPMRPGQIAVTYRAMCPNCGRTVELEKG